MKKIWFLILFTPFIYSQDFYLKIMGKDVIQNKTIDSIGYVKKFKLINALQNETLIFEKKINYLGFYQSDFVFTKINDSVFNFEGNLGNKTKKIIIDYKNISENITTWILNKKEFLPQEIENYLNNIISTLEKKGYVESKVFLSNFKEYDGKLFVNLNIELKNKRLINEITIQGYDDFPKTLKKNILNGYKNKVLTTKNTNQIENQFRNLPFVMIKKPAAILLKKDSTCLYIYAEKRKTNTFDGYIGINNKNGRSKLNGYVDLKLLNNLNFGEQLNLFWKNDGNQQSVFNLQTDFAYVLKLPIALKANLEIIKKDSTFQNTNTQLNTGYHLDFNSKIYIGIKQQTSEAINNATINIKDLSSEFYTVSFNKKKYNFDNKLFSEIFQLNFEIGLGKRKAKNNNQNQKSFLLSAQQLLKITQKNYIFLKTENYYLNSNTYLTNELYRFGGINSVRGFAENTLQGNLLTSLQTEFRHVLAENLYFNTITDWSYTEDKANATKNNLYSLGIGLGILNNFGVLNLIYANGTNNVNLFSLSNSLFQINFKTQF